MSRSSAGKISAVDLRPAPARLRRTRLARAALLLLEGLADGGPLFCGCEDAGCPACD